MTVTVKGFGTMGIVERKAKKGRNIKTGETIDIDELGKASLPRLERVVRLRREAQTCSLSPLPKKSAKKHSAPL